LAFPVRKLFRGRASYCWVDDWEKRLGNIPGKSNGPAPAMTKTLAGAVVVLAVAG